MKNAREQLREARAEARAGRLEAAAAICREVLARDPGRLEACYVLGLDAARRGDAKEAVRQLERYLGAYRADTGAWLDLGAARRRAGDPDGAASAYRRALRLAPAAVPARLELARLERARGRLADALAVLEGAPEATFADPALAALHAHCLIDAGRPGAARARLERVDGEAAEALLLAHARAALADGELAPAIARLEEAPSSAARDDALAVLLARARRPGEAAAAARRAAAAAPEEPRYWFNLAAILSKRTAPEELREASEAARRSLALAAAQPAAWHCLGLVAAKLEQSGDAEAALRRATGLAPEHARFAVDLGDFLVQRGREAEGIAALERAAAGSDPDGEAARQLGVALLRTAEPARALAALDQAEARAPADQRVIAHRALALQHLGRHGEAERYLGLDAHVRSVRLAAPPGFDDLAAFNRALADDIRHHSRLRWEPIGLAARNGALTEELLADRTPAILGFEARLREAIEGLRRGLRRDERDPFLRCLPGPAYELNIWATCVAGGGHIDTHIHEESWLSGAYYVALPPGLGDREEDPAGWIEFGRPHAELPPAPGARLLRLRPEPGLLVLFPSFLFHRTLPHRDDADRISISFDLVPR